MAIRPVIETNGGSPFILNVTGLPTAITGNKYLSDELSKATLNTSEISFNVTMTVPGAAGEFMDIYLIGTNTAGQYGSTDDVVNTNRHLISMDLAETTKQVNIVLSGKIPPFFKLLFVPTNAIAATNATVDYTKMTVTDDGL